MKKALIVTITLIALGLTSLIIYRNYISSSPTLESLVAQSSFAFLQPPTDFMNPGTIAVIEEGNGGVLKIICPCETAFGAKVQSKYVIGNSTNIDLNQVTKGSFDLNLSYLNSLSVSGRNDLVNRVSIRLTNVKILELPDDAVFELLSERSEWCIQAINDRVKNGQKTTMVKRVFQADAEYKVDFKNDLSEDIKADIVKDLSVELAGSNSTEFTNTIIGKGLYWGVDDDSRLGALQPGTFPSTGSVGAKRITDSLSTYRVEYDQISYRVSGIEQPSEMSCWISVYAMMRSWKDNKEYGIDEVLLELSEQWTNIYSADEGLPESRLDDFLLETGLQSKPPASYVPSFYTDLLKDHGPIWLITGNGLSSHAKLLIGISGDNTGGEAILTFIDPKDGRPVRQKFLEFIQDYEREAIFVNEKRPDLFLRTQILHF